MTRVCLLGNEDVNLQYELLSRETARDALATYDLQEPFENAVGLETVSLGAAVSLLNDLDWYLRRFVDESMVLEPSVSDDEWLSRSLATAIRDDDVAKTAAARYLKVYGVERPTRDDASTGTDEGSRGTDGPGDAEPAGSGGTDETSPVEADGIGDDDPPRLVEPMFVTRTGSDLPAYDLRDVDETVVERVTEREFGA